MTQNNDSKKVFIQKNKNKIISVLVILLIVLAFIFATLGGKKDVVEETGQEVVENTEEVVEVGEVSIPSGIEAYESQIALHEGKIIEVTDICTAKNDSVTIALGDTALLVNSSDFSQDFTMGDDTFSVGSRHYKTLRFKEVQTATISCGDAEIATVQVI